MIVREIIDRVFTELGYSQTQKAIDLCTKRFVGYIYEACCLESYANPIAFSECVTAKDRRVFESDFKYRPRLNTAKMSQDGRILKFTNGYNLPKHYILQGLSGDQVFVTYDVCAPSINSENDSIELFWPRIDKIVRHVAAREKMYANERGTPMRINEFSNIEKGEFGGTPGTIYLREACGTEFIVSYLCPCGCGVVESLEAFEYNPTENATGRSRCERKTDAQGRSYTVISAAPKNETPKCTFEIVDQKISLKFPRKKNKVCQSEYAVNDSRVEWRQQY